MVVAVNSYFGSTRKAIAVGGPQNALFCLREATMRVKVKGILAGTSMGIRISEPWAISWPKVSDMPPC